MCSLFRVGHFAVAQRKGSQFNKSFFYFRGILAGPTSPCDATWGCLRAEPGRSIPPSRRNLMTISSPKQQPKPHCFVDVEEDTFLTRELRAKLSEDTTARQLAHILPRRDGELYPALWRKVNSSLEAVANCHEAEGKIPSTTPFPDGSRLSAAGASGKLQGRNKARPRR